MGSRAIFILYNSLTPCLPSGASAPAPKVSAAMAVPFPLVLLSLISTSVLAPAAAWPWNPKVTTANGVVEGYDADDVMVFHSIPFAEPPVGRLRFRPPVYPAAPWQGIKDVKGLPSVCPQLKVTPLFHMGTEDCLQLHVYVPKAASAAAAKSGTDLPVLFWIFGGGYVMGDGYQETFYDAKTLAKAAGAIVVAPNYRVGPFGFLSHDALQREDPERSTGNMGVRDQQAALGWVRDNIHAFGGDKSRVTIFGESAGGFSVCWHLANPRSRGLFHRAIVESGSCDAQEFFRPVRDQNAFGDAFAKGAVGCDHTKLGGDAAFLECLRSKSTEEVMNGLLSWFNPNWPGAPDLGQEALQRGPSLDAWARRVEEVDAKAGLSAASAAFLAGSTSSVNSAMGLLDLLATGLPALAPVMPWGPVIDGTDAGLLDMPLTLLRSGKGNYVPTIWGSNKNEGTIFVPLVSLIIKGGGYPLDAKTFNATMQHFFNPSGTAAGQQYVEAVAEIYPLGDYQNDQDVRAATVLRDCFFSCAMRRGARAMDDHGAKSWLYHFEFPLRGIMKLPYAFLGNFHASELGFVFKTWVAGDSVSQQMSSTFQRYWGNLAHTGDVNADPAGSERLRADAGWHNNGPARVAWPHHNRSTDLNIVLDMPPQAQKGLYHDKCDFWDEHL